MKRVVKMEKRMFNQGFCRNSRFLINDDWCSNGDWICHRSKCDCVNTSIENTNNLTDSMIDGVLDQTVDESIRFYRTKERVEIDGRQCVLFKAADDKERIIQLRYVRYFGLKTLYSKDQIADSMLWSEDRKFFIMPVRS